LEGDQALKITGNLDHKDGGGANLQQVITEIDNGRPLAITLVNLRDIGHMVLITGYNNNNPNDPKVEIYDPAPRTGHSVCDFNKFPYYYGNFPKSSWFSSFFTKLN
jgi:hypothetical protein